VIYMQAKFEISSFNRSRDMEGFRIFCCTFKRAAQSWVMLKKTPIVALLTPLPWKLGGWVGEISMQLLKLYLYDRTSGIHLIAIHCMAAKCGELIQNKKEKKRKFISKI